MDLVEGDADISTASGELRIGGITGAGMIKNSDGDVTIGEVSADLLVRTANGNISVDRVHSSVTTAKSACGDLRIGDVTAGTIVAETAYGDISIGIREGAQAWLDVSTGYGHVRNALDPADAPQQSDTAVDVRARTS